ncbi:MAG: toll/interleukin-1 receptor domain-containing protein [Myxococcales bacterium]
MAWVPGFVHDVFISHAHVDNDFAEPEKQGWVRRLQVELTKRLPERLGRSEGLSVWLDERMRGSANVDREILDVLRSSATIVCIVSKGWIESSYCVKELDAFENAARRSGEWAPAEHRVIKVIIGNVPRESQPPVLADQNGHRFYEIDPVTARTERFRRTIEADPDQRHWKALNDLASDLAETLSSMAAARGKVLERARPPAAADPVLAVFLAEAADDVDDFREDLRRSLRQTGFAVRPESPLPTEPEPLRQRLAEDLASCRVSIHLLGKLYGKRLGPGGPSVADVQLQEATRLGVQRIVWVDPTVDPAALASEDQRRLISSAETSRDFVHTGGLEALKDLVAARCRPEQLPAQPSVDPGAMVYVACRPEDDADARKLALVLKQARHDVVLPAREGDPETLDRHHQSNLRNCDAFVVLYGTPPPLWARERAIETTQLSKQRKVAPNLLLSVVDGPPPMKEDLGLEFQNLLLVPCRDGVQADRVQQLLAHLEARR